MNKPQSNDSGFSVVELFIVFILIVLVAASGWLVYQKQHKSTATANTTQSSYTGWEAYSSTNNMGLTFKYPNTWTISDNDPNHMCAGNSEVTIAPSVDEVKSAFQELGVAYTAPSIQNNGGQPGSYYKIIIEKAGHADPSKCGSDNGATGVYDWTGQTVPDLLSSEKIQSGVLKNTWLTFYSGAGSAAKSDPDSMVVSNNSYTKTSTKFTDSAIVTLKGSQYQIVPVLGENFGQYSVNTTVHVNTFKSTELYKNTSLLLNSID